MTPELKKRFLEIANYIPGAIILLVSLIALYASLVVMNENQNMQHLYEVTAGKDTASIEQFIVIKDAIVEKNRWLYWSVWVLGLMGFVLVLMNIDKLRRLKATNAQLEESLGLFEGQLEGVQKAEKDKEALQEQLHQAQKLEAVGRLAGGIAHDFNNILAAMNGYAEFLIDDLDEKSKQHGFAENILAAGMQARDLVDKMLAFSRRDVNEVQPMHLSDSVSETVSMLKASIPKTVDLQIDIQDETRLIEGSQNLISQALMNLCVNAKDAMPDEKGTLMVSMSVADMEYFEGMQTDKGLPKNDDLPLIEIEDVSPTHTCLQMGKLSRDHEYLCLTIADNGSGMSRLVMENIFEPFFTTKPVDKGTGLGLAMVHGVIATHKGAMQINSIAGKGTRFDLLFPISGVATANKKEARKRDTWQAVGSVLVVDDQEEVRTVTVTMLERGGFEVESCEDGKAALEILSEHPDYFNVIVTDHNMPNMSGLELIEAAQEKGVEVPFILVTGYSPDSMEGLMEKNELIQGILKKPVDRAKLVEVVQNAVLERQFAA